MKKIEQFVIGHYLSDYPHDYNFSEIMRLIKNENWDKVIVCETYELFPNDLLIDEMKRMLSVLKIYFGDI